MTSSSSPGKFSPDQQRYIDTTGDGEVDTLEGRETLKTYLRERCTIDSDSGAVDIEGSDGKTQLAEDTWRTAGTSQKVASGFGSDVRKCVSSKLTSERKE